MLASGTPMFLMISGSSDKKVLLPGKVTESNDQAFTAQFESPLEVEPGAEVVAYGDHRGKFHQQGATVAEIKTPGDQPIIAFQRVGEFVSAEQRQTFRVSVALSDMFATVGKEKNCRIMDVSPEGFAAVLKADCAIGSTVQVSLTVEGHSLVAPARVQTAKVLPDGRVRYGFLIPDKKSPARRTLEQLSSSIQRQQLRRLSGAA